MGGECGAESKDTKERIAMLLDESINYSQQACYPKNYQSRIGPVHQGVFLPSPSTAHSFSRPTRAPAQFYSCPGLIYPVLFLFSLSLLPPWPLKSLNSVIGAHGPIIVAAHIGQDEQQRRLSHSSLATSANGKDALRWLGGSDRNLATNVPDVY